MNTANLQGLKSGWLDWAPRVGLVLLLAIIQVAGTHFAAQEDVTGRKALDTVSVPLLIAGPVLVGFAPRFPVLALIGVIGITLAYLGLNYAYGPVFLSVIAVLFVAVMHGYRWVGWIGTTVIFVAHIFLEILLGRGAPVSVNEAATFGLWFFVVLIAAEVARARRERVIQLERNREEEARHRTTQERLRIARELHDVFAHNISLINVQAGVALHLMDQQPEQARSSLTAIKEASRDVLRELRSTLGVLRQVDEDAPRSPAPSLTRLDDLVSGARASGLDVDVVVSGARRPLPPGVDLAAYRIIQEALTNVARHAGTTEAAVRLSFGSDELTIQIEDSGRGQPLGQPGSEGLGIRGMKERAAALGGKLDAGPLRGGGFRVECKLPLKADGFATEAGS